MEAAENDVAMMERPAAHHGIPRLPRKYASVSVWRRLAQAPMPTTAAM